MTSRTIAVLSAGLSVPSSTRLLADRLAAAAVDAGQERGVPALAGHRPRRPARQVAAPFADVTDFSRLLGR